MIFGRNGASIPAFALFARSDGGAHCLSTAEELFLGRMVSALRSFAIAPAHPVGEVLFSAHMAQHELLMVVAVPLFVLARPLAAMLWGLPFVWRRTLGHWSKRQAVLGIWRFFTHPMTAWWVHAAALWLGHVPRFFQATLDNDWIHSAQHLSFLGSALLFWWSLFYAHGKARYGAACFTCLPLPSTGAFSAPC